MSCILQIILSYSFIVNLEIRYVSLSTLIFYFKIVLAILGLLLFHMNFRVCFSQKPSRILIKIMMNLYTIWRKIDILIYFIIYEQSTYLHLLKSNFFSSIFYSFQHVNLAHILLNLS